MEKTPTAVEFAHTKYLKRREEVLPGQFYPEAPTTEQINDMIEFAKLHVEAALEEASKKSHIQMDEHDLSCSVDKSSILNAYPLENIK